MATLPGTVPARTLKSLQDDTLRQIAIIKAVGAELTSAQMKLNGALSALDNLNAEMTAMRQHYLSSIGS